LPHDGKNGLRAAASLTNQPLRNGFPEKI